MGKGCLLLATVFAVALLAERFFLAEVATGQEWPLAALLAGCFTLFLGGIWGVLEAFRTRVQPETDRALWRHGQKVRVGGVVQPSAPVLRTPFLGAEAVAMQVEMKAASETPHEASSSSARFTPPSIRVIDGVPFGIQTAQGCVAVSGSPSLRHFRPVVSKDQTLTKRAVDLLLAKKWQAADFAMGNAIYEQYLDQQAKQVQLYLANPRAVGTLFAPDGQPRIGWFERESAPQLQGQAAVEALSARLAERPWQFEEYVLAPGAEVTIEGTYLENPPRVEVGRWMLDGSAMNALRPGLPAATASGQWWQAIGFTAVMGALTIALHGGIYGRGGDLYREFAEWLGTFPR